MKLENLFDLKGKNAIITGASSGICKETAKYFAKQGVNCALAARSEDIIRECAQEWSRKYQVNCIAKRCDVSSGEDVAAFADFVKNEYQTIDILINGAGVTEKAEDITAYTEKQWDRVFDTDMKGYFLMTKHVVPVMKSMRYGRIINISSICGMMGVGSQIGYASAKSAVAGFTNCLAVELGKYNITANAVAPGYILSGMTREGSRGHAYFKSRTALGRTGVPKDLFGTFHYLASDASGYVTGDFIYVDGGIHANL